MKGTITTTVETENESVGPNGADYELYGTWDGASIDIEIFTLNGEWETLGTFTANTLNATIASTRNRYYRFKATVVGAGTMVKFAINR